jgi:hypothetical protein
MITPFSSKTNDELLHIVYSEIEPDTLMLELAYRLEELMKELEL